VRDLRSASSLAVKAPLRGTDTSQSA
jgi:hypothetical protein